ncbi:hypothetical protein [Helicobacter sp. MIT 11-5569]|nr:hypothetical protein [Helicobacter sp. MIT 11-5569]
MRKTTILLIFLPLMLFCFNACSTRGHANSEGASGYTEWRFNF